MKNDLKKYKIESFFLQTAEEKEAFFSWCLKKRLYKEDHDDGNELFLSRMKKVYEGFKPTDKAMATVAFQKGHPIAISLLELNHAVHLAKIVQRDQRRKLGYKILNEGPFAIHHIGFMSLYVKEEHRNQGLAKMLFQSTEEKVASYVANGTQYQKNDIMAYQCLEKALEIAKKYSQWGYPMHISPIAGNFVHEMSNLADEVITHRLGETSLRREKIKIKKDLIDLSQPKINHKLKVI